MPGANRSPAPEEATPLMPDIIGLLGVALAIIGMSDLLLGPHLVVLLASSVCMPISYFGRRDWPVWIRWWLAFATNAFLVLVAWSYLQRSGIIPRSLQKLPLLLTWNRPPIGRFLLMS